MQSYYVDSCIYLNLWQKESDDSGELWKFAKKFFEKVENENSIIYYSGFLLKELLFIFDEYQFMDKLELFNSSPNFRRINLMRAEYELVKDIKNRNKDISLYDIAHMLLAKKTGSILVTRDNLLIGFAKKYNIMCRKPEELL